MINMASRVSTGGRIAKDADSGADSPFETGNPTDQWTSGANVKASDNVRAKEKTNCHKLDTSKYTFSVPAGATILGIEVKVEGKISVGGILE